jgi:hypothetical protein
MMPTFLPLLPRARLFDASSLAARLLAAVFCTAALLAGACNPSATNPTVANAGFEERCADTASGACAWDVAYNARSEIAVVNHAHGHALQIAAEEGVGFVVQEIRFAEPPEEGILNYSASIRTDSVTGNGAGLNIGVYDADSLLLQNVDMGYGNFSSATGTTDWQRYDLSAVVSRDAASVHLGLINYGSGRAVFDSVRVDWQPLRGRRASAYATEYIDVAMDHVRGNSLQRDSVDLAAIRKKALQVAGNAETADEICPAIRFLLGRLGDHHSFLMTAKERALWQGDTSDDGNESDVGSSGGASSGGVAFSTAERVGEFGLVAVPGFHSNDESHKVAFADTLQGQLRRMYDGGVAGWIIDLRRNDGGNMAPMLAGLEPLFSADTLGFLIDVEGEAEAWGRGESFAESEGDEFVSVANPVILAQRLPIAVLYGAQTGSSGEIVILSFVGNAGSRSFGQPSMGLTTGNGEFELPDGSYMYMASTRMADRFRRVYHGPVTPDVVVYGADAVVDAAVAWLKNGGS